MLTLPDVYIIHTKNNENELKFNWLTLGLPVSVDLQNKVANFTTKNPLYSSTNSSSIEGLLNVVVLVDNRGIGNKSSSDFNITVHANNPNPSSFSGRISGTNIKLGMGMYSISENYLKDYVPNYSSDCFGGIMSNLIKKCIITNIYTNVSAIPSHYK
ncbi:MAG: hypothetical protein ACTHKJ_08855 [Candidatus Nitrosocosmicus sp.]